MFYDAHYLYPRPWTQEQSAPGVPAAAPLAFYGVNTVSQSFRAGSDQLAMIAVPLSGAPGTRVTAVLKDDRAHVWEGVVTLNQGQDAELYQFSFAPISDAYGRTFELTLSASGASAAQPVLAYAVGGDRLGASWRLNQFSRPGNLALTTYASGAPGRWWFAGMAEQLLPEVFRLRLQQYKPPAFKGALFGWLLGLTGVLTFVLLWLARPGGRTRTRNGAALGWALVMLLGVFLAWQALDGRLQIRGRATEMALVSTTSSASPASKADSPLLYADLTSDLWSAAREPEARFVETTTVEGFPAILAPAGSRLRYALNVPPDGRLRLALHAMAEFPLNAEIRVNDEIVKAWPVSSTRVAPPGWVDIDLSPWIGQGVSLTLATEKLSPGAAGTALWIMPQISTSGGWLSDGAMEDSVNPAGYTFANAVKLRGFDVIPAQARVGEMVTIQLIWEALTVTERYGTVFVHLVDGDGRLVAQHDGQPVRNVFPIPEWRAGMIIRDDHTLQLPADLLPGAYTMYVGIYDPDSQERWLVTGPEGQELGDGRAPLVPALEIGS
jgi:hypothetical protein